MAVCVRARTREFRRGLSTNLLCIVFIFILIFIILFVFLVIAIGAPTVERLAQANVVIGLGLSDLMVVSIVCIAGAGNLGPALVPGRVGRVDRLGLFGGAAGALVD